MSLPLYLRGSFSEFGGTGSTAILLRWTCTAYAPVEGWFEKGTFATFAKLSPYLEDDDWFFPSMGLHGYTSSVV